MVGRYTGYVMPWLALGLAPAAAAAAGTRQWALAALAGASLAAVVALNLPRLDPPQARAAGGAHLTVMSYNTWARNEDAARIAAVVRGVAPDVLLLQELRPATFARLALELRGLYGDATVHHTYDRRLMQAVVSRHAVEPVASLRGLGQAQKVVVHAPAGPITVYNVHPLRSGGWRFRHDQIAELLEREVLQERTPVLVGGDFNSPEHSQLYRLLTRHLANAHDAAGTGFGFTFPTPAVRLLGRVPLPSVVRIDHIFAGRGLVAVRAGTLGDHGGSDHRPVFADFVLE